MNRLFEAVAAATDKAPTDLPPLVDILDPEALDRLWESADDSVTLSFQYHGCEVTVHGDGSIEAAGLDD